MQGTDFAEPLEQAGRTEILWRGRQLAYFAGCDYFRLSSAPAVLRAVKSALHKFGLNVAASRKTTGNHPLYEEMEARIARFFAAERACLVSNGYLTNIIAAQALQGAFDAVFIDERAHASLKDAARFLECPVIPFPHRQPASLGPTFKKRSKKIALLTDGLFAHSGSLAPLREYRAAIGSDALLWVDDSHAAGVMGAQGQGTLEAAGLSRQNALQTVTFSKAFGVYGGAILTSALIGSQIVERSSALSGNTPLPLPLAAGVLASIQWLEAHPNLRAKIEQRVRLFWKEAGFNPPNPWGPIASFTCGNPEKLRKRLITNGVFPSHIRYPGGPAEGYFRFAISSAHSAAQIGRLARSIAGTDAQPLR